jgi:hypothetical protein
VVTGGPFWYDFVRLAGQARDRMACAVQVWLKREHVTRCTPARIQKVVICRMRPFALRAEPAAAAEGGAGDAAAADEDGDEADAVIEQVHSAVRQAASDGCRSLLAAAAQHPSGAAVGAMLRKMEVCSCASCGRCVLPTGAPHVMVGALHGQLDLRLWARVESWVAHNPNTTACDNTTHAWTCAALPMTACDHLR